MESLSARALSGLPEVGAGADLGALISSALAHDELRDEHVLAIAHKVVSKSEGAVVPLDSIVPSPRAQQLALELHKDPRAVQVVLDESEHVLRAEREVMICRTRHGFVCANAGVDASNAPAPEVLVLLPRDPDASARKIRARVRELTGCSPAVVVSDSFGRAWRHGQLDVAIGIAGMQPLDDWRGRADATGLELQATWLAVADAAAACGELVRAKDSREPVVLIEGLGRHVTRDDGPGAAALLRAREEDLFP